MRLITYILFMTISHSSTAKPKKEKPSIGDIDAFTEFIYKKWQKLAKKAELETWSERRYNTFDAYIIKLINKMKKGEENCNRVIEKIQNGIEDDETQALRRRRQATDDDNKDEKAKARREKELENFDPEIFRRTIMHQFHKKVSESEARRKKQGARSSLTHWLTHIFRKFKQILDYHILECTVSPVDHENLSGRYERLSDRRAQLKQMGEKFIQKSKAHYARKAKQAQKESQNSDEDNKE